MKCFLLLAAAYAAVIAGAAPVEAGPRITTSFSYYSVSGSSLPDVYRTMVSNAPSAGGVRGYGVTTASPAKQMNVASCRASGRYQIGVNINIRLPKISSAARLTSAETAQWSSFVQFVKRHEETHRSIWATCAAEFERRFLAGAPADCAAAHGRAMALWRQMVAICMPRQQAFDQSQRSALKSHPFMKYASR